MAAHRGGGSAPVGGQHSDQHPWSSESRQIPRLAARALGQATKGWDDGSEKWLPIDLSHFGSGIVKVLGSEFSHARVIQEGERIPNDLCSVTAAGERQGCELAVVRNPGSSLGSEYLTISARALVRVRPGTLVLGTRGRPCWLLRSRNSSAVSGGSAPAGVDGSVSMCVGVGSVGSCASDTTMFGDSKVAQSGCLIGSIEKHEQNPKNFIHNHSGPKQCLHRKDHAP